MKLSQKMRAYTLGLSEDWEYMDKLEVDSKLLEDLIEMLAYEGKFFHAEASGYYVYYGDYGDENKYTGSTPREAIAAAIKEWKGCK